MMLEVGVIEIGLHGQQASFILLLVLEPGTVCMLSHRPWVHSMSPGQELLSTVPYDTSP